MGNGTTRRELLARSAGWGAAMGMSAAVGNGHERGRQRPNFVVIVADDMGFSDPGCYGGEVRTPNLDGLARGGIRFSQAYSTARCWPSRTCLLTGYYAQQVRMDPPEGRLPAWARVLPDYLKPAGYRCLHAGKWHLMGAPKVVADGGFDRSYVIHDHDRYFCPQKHELDDRPLAAIQPGSDFYLTTHIADRAIGFLDQHAASHGSDPFCLFLAFTSPHFPLHAPAADIERYRQVYLEGWDRIRERRWRRMRRMGLVRCALPPADPEIVPPWNLSPEDLARMIGPGEAARAVPWETLSHEQRRFQATKMAIHAAMVDRMDREIGRVIGKLEAMGARDDTVVLFVSDNGASAEQIIRGDKHDTAAEPGSAKSYLCLGPGWSTAANTPFRLHKSWVHEGGISSPLIVNWPSGIAARGELRHAPCHFVDVIPTLADLAGVTIQPHHGGRTAPPLPGVSLVPAFGEDRAIERDCLYFHHIGNRALRVGDWKLVAAAQGPWELYDLGTDRSEMRNMAARYPDRVAEMAARWQRLEDTFRSQAGQSGQQ